MENEKGETVDFEASVLPDKSQLDLVKREHKNIFSALSAFQGELKPIEKTGHVNFKAKNSDLIVDFKYAPLETVMKAIYPLLAKNGLSVRHEISEKSVECILTHETTGEKEQLITEHFTGEFKETKKGYVVKQTNELRSGKLVVDLTKPDMKDVGGQITYGRRYTLGLVLGIATEEDKDTELMDTARANTEKFAFTQAKNSLEKATGEELDKQVHFLEGELKIAKELEAGIGKVVPSLGLKASQYETLLEVANNKKENGGK